MKEFILNYVLEASVSEPVLESYAYQLEMKLEAEVLDRCERRLNELGWFKERTCKPRFHNSYFAPCDCGYGVYFDMNYCPKCGSKVVK